ncbi:MAG TPA: PIN domain-containing protein [Peptococcaceae bacterium]|jgi:predicted nucleic acid-binding protein|uniref:PIN domain-containing protein n=1 Tax=anaerobic digester metagenome TaxID=1263854 RepID=A0A485LXE8_9ZZZZ|nr:PIN domain-containing protein [Peptococcaceae bacterium]
MERKRILILDANTLIDYLECDRTIIKLICRYVGQIYLATPVLNEINEIDEDGCIEIGIKLLGPELEQVMSAAARKGPLSFQDNLCLILAKEHGLTCVTNDKALRRACELQGVPLIWGIELICILVESGGLPVKHAQNIILTIQRNNPKYITDSIVKSAFKRLGITV